MAEVLGAVTDARGWDGPNILGLRDPRRPIYTTIRELGPKMGLGFRGLGFRVYTTIYNC